MLQERRECCKSDGSPIFFSRRFEGKTIIFTMSNDDQAPVITPDLANPIVEKLGELFSREEKKTIPIYKGKSTDKLVTDWLKDAERVARNNNWTPDQKIRFFSDRLGGEALDWHVEYVDDRPTLNFADWKRDFIIFYRHLSSNLNNALARLLLK